MADNTTVTPGAGEVLRTKDLGGVKAQAMFQGEWPPSAIPLSAASSHVTAVGGSSVPLPNIPGNATHALVSVESADIRWLDTGTTPTATIGMPLVAGSYFWISGRNRIVNWKMISAGSASVTVTYYYYPTTGE
jgi:hypothetical protein